MAAEISKNDFEFILRDILRQFNEGEAIAAININDKQICIEKAELRELFKKQSMQSCDLIQATLKEYKVNPNQIGKVDFCYDSQFNCLIGEEIQFELLKMGLEFTDVHIQSQIDYRSEFTQRVRVANWGAA